LLVRTAFRRAAHNNNLKIIRSLLKADADRNIQNKYKSTALTWALNNNNPEAAKLLVTDYNKNLSDSRGFIPLTFAVMLNLTAIVKILLDAGADINIQDPQGRSPLQLARSQAAVGYGDPRIVNLIKQKLIY